MTGILSGKLTTEELAKELHRNPKTLIRWRRQRRGPPWIRIQGRVLYDRKHVEAWIEKQLVEMPDGK